jgi:hypothetical protein
LYLHMNHEAKMPKTETMAVAAAAVLIDIIKGV